MYDSDECPCHRTRSFLPVALHHAASGHSLHMASTSWQPALRPVTMHGNCMRCEGPDMHKHVLLALLSKAVCVEPTTAYRGFTLYQVFVH